LAAGAGVAAVLALGGRATAAVVAVSVLLAAGAIGWVLVGLRWRGWPAYRTGRGGLAVTAPVLLVVAAVVLATVGSGWWVEGRHVHASTTALPPPSGGDSGPARPGAVRWRGEIGLDVTVGAGYVVAKQRVGDGYQVNVLDAATGRLRWFYRDDAAADVWMDGVASVLLLRVFRNGAVWLRAFDLPSGHPLWSRRDPGLPLADASEVVSARRPLPAGVLVLTGAAGLRGVDPRTGVQRWRREGDSRCPNLVTATRAMDLLLLRDRCAGGAVVALRAGTGEVAWRLPGDPEPEPVPPWPQVRVVDGVAGMVFSDRDAIVVLTGVDVATGRVLWRRPLGPELGPVMVLAGRFAVLAADIRPGAPRDPRRPDLLIVDPRSGRTVRDGPLPVALPTTANSESIGSDGQRLYLLGNLPVPGPTSVRLTVFDAGGQLLGRASFAGCDSDCQPGQLPRPSSPPELQPVGGALLLLPPYTPGPVTALGDGSAYRGTT
jgi:hypothetical protein